MVCCISTLLFVGSILILYALYRWSAKASFNLQGAHVLVTGGSSGIGKNVAIEVVKRGASVTLLARNSDKLAEAKLEVEKAVVDDTRQKVTTVSVDLSSNYAEVESAIRRAEEANGPVDMLVNSAGFSVSGRFEDIPIGDFTRLLNVNYIGSVFATRAVIRGMKERLRGSVVFVSSQAGQMGVFGFSGYCASKFALRGLAESLQMEVKPYNVRVCVSFPPDTDTPGFEEEMKTKPEETRLISEAGGLFDADVVARGIVDDAVAGKFLSYVGIDGFLLSTITCGMAPVFNLVETLLQVLFMGLFRAIATIFLFKFDVIVKRCKKSRENAQQSSSEKDKKQ